MLGEGPKPAQKVGRVASKLIGWDHAHQQVEQREGLNFKLLLWRQLNERRDLDFKPLSAQLAGGKPRLHTIPASGHPLQLGSCMAMASCLPAEQRGGFKFKPLLLRCAAPVAQLNRRSLKFQPSLCFAGQRAQSQPSRRAKREAAGWDCTQPQLPTHRPVEQGGGLTF